MFKKVLIALMVVLMMVTVSSARTINEVDLPETLTAGDQVLLLNGGGTREAFFNDVYVSGLWLEKGMTDGNAIAAADEPMAIRLHVLNDFFASSKHITDAFKKGFRFAMPRGDVSSVKDEMARLNVAFSDEITDHEEFDIVYIPNKGTSIYKEGELKDTIPGLEFKRLLFGIWVSEKATVNEDLTEGMLEGKISPESLAAKEQWIAKIKVEKEAGMAEATAKKAAAETEAKAAAEAKAAEGVAMKAAAEAKLAAAANAKAAEAAAMQAKAEAAAEVKVAEMVLTKANFGDDDVFFGLNSSSLSADAKKTLSLKAKWLKSNPVASVAVEVYCDSRGSKQYNMALAERRAKSVVNFMAATGIDASRMETVIFGAVESAANESAWANNRRAHFKIK